MEYNDSKAAVTDHFKQAVPIIVDKEISGSPVNHAFWYNNAAKNIPLLIRAMQNIINDSGSVSAEESYELFFQYILQDELKEQNQALQDITQVASQILKRVGELIDGSETFDHQLESEIKQLDKAVSQESVTHVIDQIMSATQNIRFSNTQFKDSLKQANDEIDTLRGRLEEAERQIYTDQLTQISNRYAFDRKLSELTNDENGAENVFLILADLDHFKSVNDSFGHVVGDQVLQNIGMLLRESCKGEVFAARYGGEEFAILIKDGTPSMVGEIAESIRKSVTELSITLNNSAEVLNHFSASFGVARYIKHEPVEDFIHRADSALYRAKDKGRNRVET